MKVINKNNGHRWWVDKIFTCGHCNSNIQLDESDEAVSHVAYKLTDEEIVSRFEMIPAQGMKRTVEFNCPVCHHIISVMEE